MTKETIICIVCFLLLVYFLIIKPALRSPKPWRIMQKILRRSRIFLPYFIYINLHARIEKAVTKINDKTSRDLGIFEIMESAQNIAGETSSENGEEIA